MHTHSKHATALCQIGIELPCLGTTHADSFAAFRQATEPRNVGAPSVARLALALRARGERQKIDAVKPLYLRKTEAERKLERGEL